MYMYGTYKAEILCNAVLLCALLPNFLFNDITFIIYSLPRHH